MYFVWLALRALYFWRREPPIQTPADLVTFVETRSKYVSQRTLFGYVKARAGTRYVSLFEDEVFAASVDAAKWEVYLAACPTSRCTRSPRWGAGRGSIRKGWTDWHSRPFGRGYPWRNCRRSAAGDSPGTKGVASRVDAISWPDVPADETAFAGSLDALVHWAPVADELKQYDVEALRNSMRFQWKHVRDQLTSLLDAKAVVSDAGLEAASAGSSEFLIVQAPGSGNPKTSTPMTVRAGRGRRRRFAGRSPFPRPCGCVSSGP